MLDLQILGFLDEGPLHGYELRRRILDLGGPGTRVSEGSLYPALSRLERAGYLVRDCAGPSGRARRTITITSSGRARLHQLLRETSGADLESQPRFLMVLAFLSHLPSPQERREVLRRRLGVLETPPAFFYDDGTPRRLAEEEDPYRQGMVLVAAAARRAEIAWLRQVLEQEAAT